MMITFLDIIQISYTIPSIILLTIFVILLTNEILIKKNTIFDNHLYPFILYKGYTDIFTSISTLFCSRAPKMNIFGTFYEKNDGFALYYYIVIGITYTIMYEISFITSFNRFLAIVYPFLIDKWFSKKRIIIYIIITFISGIIYGIGIVFFHPYYIYLKPIKGYYIVFKSQNTPYFVMAYTLLIVLPLAIASTIMNIITVYKLTKYYKENNEKTLQDISLFIYSILNFLCFILFVVYNMTRIINYLTSKSDIIDSIAISAVQWIIDLEIFGLFYAVLFLCTPLRNLMLCKNDHNNILIINKISIKHNKHEKVQSII